MSSDMSDDARCAGDGSTRIVPVLYAAYVTVICNGCNGLLGGFGGVRRRPEAQLMAV